MTQTLALPHLVAAPPADDPFYYGWRDVRRRQPDGSYKMVQLPLTIWDVLHPQFGDTIPKSIPHTKDRQDLLMKLDARLRKDPHALVMSYVRISWDVPGLEHHAPDVAVILNVESYSPHLNDFRVAEHGVRPAFLIEVVSPHFREADTVIKVVEYHRAMVPLYVIVDRENETDDPTIIAYRYTPERYLRIENDHTHGVVLEPLPLRIFTRKDRVVLQDTQSGLDLLDYGEMLERLDAERARRRAAEESCP